jgi:hypothetical protein
MGALIVQQLNLAAGIADQEQWLLADSGSEEVPGILHLAFMADINPCRSENFLELEVENVRVGVEAPVHPTGRNHGSYFFRADWGHLLRS